MAKLLVPNKLWKRIESLIPRRRRSRKGGRPPVPDRDALRGIIFVLKTGIQWQMLPQELGCGCGMTCWRRLRDWQLAGVWEAIHRELLYELGAAGRIDWSRAALDGSNVAAKGGAAKRSGRTPRTRENQAASTICS
jgi:transposase